MAVVLADSVGWIKVVTTDMNIILHQSNCSKNTLILKSTFEKSIMNLNMKLNLVFPKSINFNLIQSKEPKRERTFWLFALDYDKLEQQMQTS